jgi:CRP/FNR family cyclic AMP-dependent transcriptional regulator
MIAPDYLKRIAAWSRELKEREIEIARAGIVEKSYRADEFIFMRGDQFDCWTGVVTGLARMGIVSRGGKAASFAGLTADAWFGEGTVLKDEPRRHDVVALRDTRIAMMNRRTFLWLFENSVGFNRFLVGQLNERLGQFIALLEYGRTLGATARLARSIASLFNPILLSGPHAASRDHAGRDRGALRHLPAERQPVPEAAGTAGVTAVGVWRRYRPRPRTLGSLRRLRISPAASAPLARPVS